MFSLCAHSRGALEWRRKDCVDALVETFDYDTTKGVLCRNSSIGSFVPSQSLIDVCSSGAFWFAGFDDEGRGILHARTGRLDWWKTGVEDGIRYHVLVLEHALKSLADRKEKAEDGEQLSESLVLCVDTTGLGVIPPPPHMFTQMASLMQRAYPDRIHRIYIGPVNAVLRKFHELILPYLRPRSRDKIVLLECAPALQEFVSSVGSDQVD